MSSKEDLLIDRLRGLLKQKVNADLPTWIITCLYSDAALQEKDDYVSHIITLWIGYLERSFSQRVQIPSANRILAARHLAEKALTETDFSEKQNLFLDAVSLSIAGSAFKDLWHYLTQYIQATIEGEYQLENYHRAQELSVGLIILTNCYVKDGGDALPDQIAFLIQGTVLRYFEILETDFSLSRTLSTINEISVLSDIVHPFVSVHFSRVLELLVETLKKLLQLWEAPDEHSLQYRSTLEIKLNQLDDKIRGLYDADAAVILGDVLKALKLSLRQIQSNFNDTAVPELYVISPSINAKDSELCFSLKVRNTSVNNYKDINFEIASGKSYSAKEQNYHIGSLLPDETHTIKVSISLDTVVGDLSILGVLTYCSDIGKIKTKLVNIGVMLRIKISGPGDELDEIITDNMLQLKLEETEKMLRTLVNTRYRQSFGSSWESHIKNKHERLYNECIKIRERASKNNTEKLVASSILDFSTFEHLRRLIIGQWVLFQPVFDLGQAKQNKFLLSLKFQEIIATRNALYHHRYQSSNEKMRAIVACNDVLKYIEASQ